MAVNFSQLRRRQSSRELLYRRQLSTLMEDAEGEAAAMRARHFSATARASLRRQLSEAAAATGSAEAVASPDEMGEMMWEMRPRFATSAGELKRRRKHERLERQLEREKEKQEKMQVWLQNRISTFPVSGKTEKNIFVQYFVG